MPPPTIGNGTLQRLSELRTGGQRVLSVYVDLDPQRFPTPASRDAQLSALLSEAKREDAGEDAKRVERLLQSDKDLMRGASALAVFSSAASGLLEAVKLSKPVEPMAVVDTVPWLEPMAAMVTSGDWGVAVMSRSSARLFRGGPKALAMFESINSEVHGRHAKGGWSQARYQRSIEEDVSTHVRTVCSHLLRAHRRRAFDHLVIVASSELQPVMEQSLHSDLSRVLTGFVEADLEHAGAVEIAHAITPIVEHADRSRESALLWELEESIGIGGNAVTGLEEVLSMLEQDRVATLLVEEGAGLTAWRCERCGRLYPSAVESCPLDGGSVKPVDGAMHAIDLAAERSSEVVMVRFEREELAQRGSIAALLRW